MAQSASETGVLDIKAGDDATEIFVINSRFKRIKSGVGKLKCNVTPGFYKVRFRSGISQHDELVEVNSGGPPCVVKGEKISFYSASPLDDTLTTHEYHSGPARIHSQVNNQSYEDGGSIFVFLREDDANRNFDPKGVTVHSIDGVEIGNIENREINTSKKWAALRLNVVPGTYPLRVTTQGLGSYELFLTVCDGWQTQIFLSYEQFWSNGKKIIAPSLRRSSIYMSQNARGFDPGSSGVRMSELARQGLTQGRDVISKPLMNRYLKDKFEFPFLGIIALHTLMRRSKRNSELIDTVIRNLGNLLHRHPDLDILRFTKFGDLENSEGQIESPPLLAASWDLLTKATRRRASLVESDSPVAQIAHNVVFGGPWLIHRAMQTRSSSTEKSSSIASAERKFIDLLDVDQSQLKTMIRGQSTEALSQLERSIADLIITNSKYADLNESRQSEPGIDAVRKLRHLSAPTYSITAAVDNLAAKMKV